MVGGPHVGRTISNLPDLMLRALDHREGSIRDDMGAVRNLQPDEVRGESKGRTASGGR